MTEEFRNETQSHAEYYVGDSMFHYTEAPEVSLRDTAKRLVEKVLQKDFSLAIDKTDLQSESIRYGHYTARHKSPLNPIQRAMFVAMLRRHRSSAQNNTLLAGKSKFVLSDDVIEKIRKIMIDKSRRIYVFEDQSYALPFQMTLTGEQISELVLSRLGLALAVFSRQLSQNGISYCKLGTVDKFNDEIDELIAREIPFPPREIGKLSDSIFSQIMKSEIRVSLSGSWGSIGLEIDGSPCLHITISAIADAPPSRSSSRKVRV